PFIGNGVCGSHHGLAATAAHSRETGYIYATGIVAHDVAYPCTDEADHTFFDRSSFSAAAVRLWSASSFFSFVLLSSRAFRRLRRRRPSRHTTPSSYTALPR